MFGILPVHFYILAHFLKTQTGTNKSCKMLWRNFMVNKREDNRIMCSQDSLKLQRNYLFFKTRSLEINSRKICRVGAQSDVVFTQTTFNKTVLWWDVKFSGSWAVYLGTFRWPHSHLRSHINLNYCWLLEPFICDTNKNSTECRW